MSRLETWLGEAFIHLLDARTQKFWDCPNFPYMLQKDVLNQVLANNLRLKRAILVDVGMVSCVCFFTMHRLIAT